MALCIECAQLLKEAGGEKASHAALRTIDTGIGTMGGRTVDTALLQCSACGAQWQRETDVRSLRQLWYLKAGSA
jgi:hypothetical protein